MSHRKQSQAAAHRRKAATRKADSKKKSKPKNKRSPKAATKRSASHSRPGEKKRTSQGEGGRQLLSAVSREVGEKSDELAKAFVSKTLAGSASHARLIVDLSGAGGLAPQPVKPRGRRSSKTARASGNAAPTAADLSGSEENWELDIEPEARPGCTPPKP
jgi:hypothetical protein